MMLTVWEVFCENSREVCILDYNPSHMFILVSKVHFKGNVE